MKLLFARSLPVWLLILLFTPALFAQQRVESIEIRHVGPAAASDELIRANIRVKVGDTYIRTGVDDDVRTLYATGLFRNIRVLEERTADGIKLVYEVQGKPVLTDISFEGNKKYKNKKLLKKVTSKIGEPLDDRKLFTDSQEIQKMYEKAGHRKTTVKARTQIDEQAGRGKVVFEIQETPKTKIERVDFIGADAFTQKKLRKVIKTRKHWMFSWLTGSGVLKEDQFEEDKEKLAEFYRNEGYIDFEIKDVQFEYPDPEHMIIRFLISEGQQYKVGSVQFKGNEEFPTEQIMKGDKSSKGVEMGIGSTFSPKSLDADIQNIRDFYGSRGYIDAGVKAVTIPNIERGTVDMVYEIEGEDQGISHIEKIEIKGNTKTKDKVIRRELAVAPGEVFDMVRVRRSKGRLEQMRYFDKVETEIEPTGVPNAKNLIIDVEEGPTGNFEFGAGFSSVDNLVGLIGYREGNFDLFNPPFFRGGGQKFRITAQIGTQRRDFQISFTEPWFLNRRLSFGTDLYWREFSYYSDLYDLSQIGGRVSLMKALGSEFLIGGLSYTMEEIGIDDVDKDAPLVIKAEPSSQWVSKFGGSLAWDTSNSVELPNRGQRTELLSELAGPFGGEADFYKLELRSFWYFPGFWQKHVLEVGGQIGVVEDWGRSERVPLFDRFFLGGISSLRGYKYHGVGPHSGDEPIGGGTMWYGTLEYSLPVAPALERLRFAVFYDIGMVYLDAYSFDTLPNQRTYNDNWGVGLRLNIPRLGPLRLDYGIPITHDRDASGSGRFQFSVGFSRKY
ncbi:MAG: outer membrane protein assembly factor BamA [Verrucomicrobiia bacterium]